MFVRTRSRLFVFLPLLSLLVAACAPAAPAAPSGPAPAAEQTLRIVAAEPNSGLNPAEALTRASHRVMELIFETLVDRNEKFEIVPALARSWDIGGGGTSYTFHLRDNAKFSDGTPITSEDVKFSLDFHKAGKALGAALQGMSAAEAVDPTTVRVTFTEPTRVFLTQLARAGSAGILSKKAVQGDPNYFRKPTATSGPWSLEEWIPKDHLTLIANPGYWNREYPRIKKIVYTVGEDATSNVAALDSGSADMYYPYPAAEIARARSEKKITLHESKSLAVLFWGLDKTKPPFSDKRVRQAFAYAVPRDERMSACWFGTGGVSYGQVLGPWNFAYTEVSTYKLSPDAAAQKAAGLLDAAGWKIASGGVRAAQGVPGVPDGTPLRITVPYEATWLQSECHTQLLQQRMKPLGVDIVPNKYPPAFWTDVAADKFQMYHGGAGADDEDSYMLRVFASKGDLNRITAKWTNPEIDRLIDQALKAQDPAQVKSLYAQVERIQVEEVPMIPTGWQFVFQATSPKLQGYYGRSDQSNRALIYSWLSK